MAGGVLGVAFCGRDALRRALIPQCPCGFVRREPRCRRPGRAADRARQYVLDSEWGDVQPKAADENAYLESHSWEEYAAWHLGLTEGATDGTKARYGFVYGDLRRLHRPA